MSSSTHPPVALIVDDEPDILELLELTLDRMGVDSRCAASYEEACRLLADERFDLCLTDMRLPDGNGIDLVRHVQQVADEMPIAMITAHGNMDSAVESLKAGAFDFVTKPVELRVLRELVQTALRLGGERDDGQPVTRQLLGDSPAMQSVRNMIARVARSQAPVYISGDSGTGKELAARLIHEQGPRANGPFIAVNCGAIPAELMESEFFGHKRGSFTGATADKEGLFQAASGGTLFLDEVADLPLSMQVKLLRAIQEKCIRPVGGTQEVPVDVRILSATHKDLGELVKQGGFRNDLFYRINVIQLLVPTLRERREDIPLLAAHLLGRLASSSGDPPCLLTEEAEQALCQYHFPGNVRELENILERAVTLAAGNRIEIDDLALPIQAQRNPSPQDAEGFELQSYIEGIEREVIEKALADTDFNKTAAARQLGITFRSLRYRLKKLGLE